jgi:signal transduction histidine kinase
MDQWTSSSGEREAADIGEPVPAHVTVDTRRPLVRDVLPAVVEGSPTAIAVFRRDRSICYRNAAWTAIVGSGDQVLDGELAPVALAIAQGLGSTSEEHGIRRPDGRASRILLSVIPILGQDGAPIGAIAYAESLDRVAAATLREAFLGVLSHELRTPITSIYGGSQLLLRDELSADSRAQVLEDIAAEAEQLHRRVEDFLAVARVERGVNAQLREPIPIKRSIEAAVAGEHRRSPDQRYLVRVDPELPPAMGDDGQVRQVLRNLLSIATEVTPPGRAVLVVASEGDGWVEVRINDRGPNLDPDALDDPDGDLFSLSYRHPAVGGHVPRSGLGLYVARALVEANGGRLWLRSRRGGGTEAGFALPAYVDAA